MKFFKLGRKDIPNWFELLLGFEPANPVKNRPYLNFAAPLGAALPFGFGIELPIHVG